MVDAHGFLLNVFVNICEGTYYSYWLQSNTTAKVNAQRYVYLDCISALLFRYPLSFVLIYNLYLTSNFRERGHSFNKKNKRGKIKNMLQFNISFIGKLDVYKLIFIFLSYVMNNDICVL